MERKTPPLVINTPEDGFLRVGLNTDAKTSRPDQVLPGALVTLLCRRVTSTGRTARRV